MSYLLIVFVLGSAAGGFLLRRRSRVASQAGTETITVVRLEICNMIAGNFKAKLAGMGSHCMLSVPTIITGGDFHMHSLADGGTLEVALEFESSLLWITLDIHS